jgi:GT2 family glycosyltransferase
MSEVPFVSIVVATRDRAGLLKDTINSLKAQSYPPNRYEIVIADDGSADGTHDLIEQLSNLDDPPALIALQTSGLGINAARNAGISASAGDPIVFVDDDVEAPPGWLSALVDGTRRYPDAGCLGGPIILRLEGKAPRLCGREPLGETELMLGERDKETDFAWGANMALRRHALDLVGNFNESLPVYGDETEWQRRLHHAGGKVVYVADAMLWHRRTASDLRLSRLIRNRFRRARNMASGPLSHSDNFSFTSAVRPIPRYLGHALRHRCSAGLLAAAGSLGIAWGMIVKR